MAKIVTVEGAFTSKFVVEDDDASDEQIIEMFEDRIFNWTLEGPDDRGKYDNAEAHIVIKEKVKEEFPW